MFLLSSTCIKHKIFDVSVLRARYGQVTLFANFTRFDSSPTILNESPSCIALKKNVKNEKNDVGFDNTLPSVRNQTSCQCFSGVPKIYVAGASLKSLQRGGESFSIDTSMGFRYFAECSVNGLVSMHKWNVNDASIALNTPHVNIHNT